MKISPEMARILEDGERLRALGRKRTDEIAGDLAEQIDREAAQLVRDGVPEVGVASTLVSEEMFSRAAVLVDEDRWRASVRRLRWNDIVRCPGRPRLSQKTARRLLTLTVGRFSSARRRP